MPPTPPPEQQDPEAFLRATLANRRPYQPDKALAAGFLYLGELLASIEEHLSQTIYEAIAGPPPDPTLTDTDADREFDHELEEDHDDYTADQPL